MVEWWPQGPRGADALSASEDDSPDTIPIEVPPLGSEHGAALDAEPTAASQPVRGTPGPARRRRRALATLLVLVLGLAAATVAADVFRHASKKGDESADGQIAIPTVPTIAPVVTTATSSTTTTVTTAPTTTVPPTTVPPTTEPPTTVPPTTQPPPPPTTSPTTQPPVTAAPVRRPVAQAPYPVTFCGYAPGSVVVIDWNGRAAGRQIADGRGCVTVTVTPGS